MVKSSKKTITEDVPSKILFNYWELCHFRQKKYAETYDIYI